MSEPLTAELLRDVRERLDDMSKHELREEILSLLTTCDRAAEALRKAKYLTEECGIDHGVEEVVNVLEWVLGQEDAEHCGLLHMYEEAAAAEGELPA